MQKSGGAPAAAPTGCYKCGRPGHWSRDCPFSPAADPDSSKPASDFPKSNNSFPKFNPKFLKSAYSSTKSKDGAAGEKPKKQLPRTMPKLTPELLLSDDGLGFVLRHFPRSFKYHGRGHEVSDLGNLIGLYAQWHARLLPYYSFDQFIQKVEKVGASRRVRMCMKDLRDRVANGGDPTKLHEPPKEPVDENPELDKDEEMVDPVHDLDAPQLDAQEADHAQEEMIDEIYQIATEEANSAKVNKNDAGGFTSQEQFAPVENQVRDDSENGAGKGQPSDEQKARMEANRLTALSRMAARSSTQVSKR